MKQRQPLVSIGANNLYKLAMAASFDVAHGDDSDPYVKEIRKHVANAHRIANKAANKKGYKLSFFSEGS